MHQLTLPATTGSLDRMVAFVDALSRAGGLSAVRAGRLRLAVEELVTNSIVHGFGTSRGPWSEILLEGCVETDYVWLRISEDAPPFDSTRGHTPQDLDRPLGERTPGGLGLYLARQAVDRMAYDYANGRNHVTVYVGRGPTSAAEPESNAAPGERQQE
ncbi:ATP-binding protein [Actinoplanes sp. NPDC049681]|uniref:ATP-binding protein n=1 Tax=Actinoplanes sp. NPDC049681 TaxID=3363905 RepID=UPI0037AC23E5